MNSLKEITSRLIPFTVGDATVLVAIDGCGGAGKSTLAEKLSHALRASGIQVAVVHFDDFYLPTALRPAASGNKIPVGGNFDWQRLRDQVLVPLRSGTDAAYERYDWIADRLAEKINVEARGIVIVEGVGSSRRELAGFYNMRVWVDCSRDVRLRRGVERDGEARRHVWEQQWMPEEDRYVAEHRPQELAEIVVSGESDEE